MVALTAFLTLLSLLRVRGTGAIDTVWAEDGSRFFQQSLHAGALKLLITPYNGYLHLAPRLAVDVARLFPLPYFAAVIAVTGALISSGLAVFVYRASAGHLRSRLLQAAVAAPLALTWVAQSEVGNNVADAQWFLVYASFWAALYQGPDKRYRAVAVSVIFFAVASDPFAAVFIPLLRRKRAQAVGMAAGLLYQGIGIVFMGALSSRAAEREYDLPRSASAYLVHVVGHVLWPATGLWLVGAVFCAGLVAWTWRGLARSRARITIAAFGYSILIYFGLTIEGGFVAERYAYPAAALLLAGIAAAAAESGQGHRLLAGAVAVSVCWGWFGGGPDARLRAHSPSWRAQVRLAAARCASSGSHRDAAAATTETEAATADVAIAPTGWKVHIPCSLLLRDVSGS
ncbi:MAG: hypothetical protein HOV87_28590 [Catenulispora sp.]|nr:hypothetical protein [Catenulispora sp.]